MKKFLSVILIGLLLGSLTMMSSCTKDYLVPAELPDEVSFSTDIQPFFDAKCIGCHGNIAPPKLEAPNAYQNLINGNYINTADPALSLLYTKIAAGGSMAQYASSDESALTLKWIEQGAKNN